MGAHDTKMNVAEILVALSATRPLAKISVSDIVNEAGMNRKTFYYHFTDKGFLLSWIFRMDMGTSLAALVEPENLLYTNYGDSRDIFPYYTYIKEGVRSLDGSPFVHALVHTFEGRRAFYAQALVDHSPSGLMAYLRKLYTPALYADIEYILSNRFLDQEQKRFLAEYHIGALLNYLSFKLSQPEDDAIIECFGPFDNIVHSSISDAIVRHQQRRAAEHA